MNKSTILSLALLVATSITSINAMDNQPTNNNQQIQMPKLIKQHKGFYLYSNGAFIIKTPKIIVTKSPSNVFTFTDNQTQQTILKVVNNKIDTLTGTISAHINNGDELNNPSLYLNLNDLISINYNEDVTIGEDNSVHVQMISNICINAYDEEEDSDHGYTIDLTKQSISFACGKAELIWEKDSQDEDIVITPCDKLSYNPNNYKNEKNK